jgi:hypothetical protein
MDIFKTPEELDMTQQEKSALIIVMHQMESGQLIHDPAAFPMWTNPTAKKFNMFSQRECVGYWMGIQMGMGSSDASTYVFKQENDTTKLRELIWGNTDRSITPDMAAKVIRNFLETGVVDWQIGYLTQDAH